MAYHDDLLRLAQRLVHEDPANPSQVDLRRGVSTAYYAVFHLLIAEATSNWSQARLRTTLGRAFDHAPMKSASNRILDSRLFPFSGQDTQVVQSLKFVAQTLSQLQEDRHFADYNLVKDLERTQALSQVDSAAAVFIAWQFIRGEDIAQDYLVSLMIKNRG